jgi:hemoglobin
MRHDVAVTEPADPAPLGDIESRADIERLVRAFYGRAFVDPTIGFIFVDVARLDLEAHLPRIAGFWETILFDVRSYSGSPFDVHAALHHQVGLRAGHFERWLVLWGETIDALFVGNRATLAKAHAIRVAQAFYGRLQTLGPGGSAGAPGGEFAGLAVVDVPRPSSR